jgi:hypothetical protein
MHRHPLNMRASLTRNHCRFERLRRATASATVSMVPITGTT